MGVTRLSEVDLLDHDVFADREPWDVFDLLQREAPVFWHPEPDSDGFWCVTKYDDVVTVLKDPRLFSSEAGGAAQIEWMDADVLEARRNFMETDPPRHSQWRRLFAKDFTPRALQAYDELVRGLVVETLDATLPRGEFDWLEEVASPIPIRVLGRLLGVPAELLARLVELGDRMIVDTDPEIAHVLAGSPEAEAYRFLPFGSEAAAELCELGRPLLAARRQAPTGDVLSILANAEIDGCPISSHDLDNNFALFIVAGNETTRQAMALGLLALIEHPDQLELLRREPALLPTAVDELLRYASPVWHFRRTATADTELRGVPIAAGQRVVVWFAAANRDPDTFPDPHRLDITRKRDVQASFGRGGPHFCLGAHLARLELAVLFSELLPRIASVELAGTPARLRSNFTNGVKRLPVRVTLRA